MGQRILVSWIGHTDLRALARTLPASKRGQIIEAVGQLDSEDGPGPVKALLNQEQFGQVHLLSNYDATITRQFAKWVKGLVSSHQISMRNPSDHGQILDAVRPVLASLDLKKDDELCFHLSPGTPAMAAIWTLLGKSQCPATLYQIHKERVWKTEIPFDITTDVLPQILREADRFWQHLASKSSRQVGGFESIVDESDAIRIATGRALRAAMHDGLLRHRVPLLHGKVPGQSLVRQRAF